MEGYARLKHGNFLNFKAHELAYRNADLTFRHVLIPHATGYSVTTEWRVRYAINSWGLRDREYALAKPPGTLRILALGDSHVEGYGVNIEDTFVKRFEAALNHGGAQANPPVTYEVINGGISGYSPLLEYLLLSRKGLQWQPDAVLLFYNFSDIRDDYEYEQMTKFDANGLPVQCFPFKRVRAHGDHPVERFLSRYSRAFLLLEHKVNVFFWHRWYPDFAKASSVDLFVAFRGSPEQIAELWKHNERYLDLIHQLLRARGIPMILISYPDAVEIDPNEWAEGRLASSFAVGQVLAQPLVVSHLANFAKDRGILFLNLYEDFKATRLRPLYFKFDGHLNAQGHRVLADALFRRLVGPDGAAPELFKGKRGQVGLYRKRGQVLQ